LLAIEKLSEKHNRTTFSCGNEELDEYLKKYASQDVKKNVAVVIVAADETQKVAGFYSLCATSVAREEVPPEAGKRLPKYDKVPGILLGRLAVSSDLQGKGIGKRLLIHAFARCASIEDIGWAFIVTDAKDESACSFYRSFGFFPLLDDLKRLYITKATVIDALNKGN